MKALERENGLGITDDSNKLIWHCRGATYEAKVIEVTGRNMVRCEIGTCTVASNSQIPDFC